MPPTPRTAPREGPLPLKTTVRQFPAPFITKAELNKLPPAVQRLTKRDLLLLGGGEFTPATKRLSVEDMHSLRTVFAQSSARLAKSSGRGGYYCCCCCCYFCCCCTAVSVTRPLMTGTAPGAASPPTPLSASVASPI